MEYQVVKDSQVLMPNLKHKNFNKTPEIIKEGTLVTGSPKELGGIRKGQPFTYYLLEIAPSKLIFLKNVKQLNTKKMDTREVTLGADGNPTSVVKIPDNSFAVKAHIWLAIGGAAAGFFYARKKGKSMKSQIIHAVVAGGAGYVIGKVIVRKKAVKVEPTK